MKETLGYILFSFSICVFIIHISLSSVIIHLQVKNRAGESINYNHQHSLLYSLSTIPSDISVLISLGPYYIYEYHQQTCTDSKGWLYDCSYYKKKSVDISKWRGTQLYGVQSLESYFYLLYNCTAPKGGKCKEGYKQCGVLDSYGNILCEDINKECPINDIIMSKSSDVPESFKQYTSYHSIQISTEAYLFYTNEAIDKPVVVDFRLSKKTPCLVNNYNDCKEKKGDPRYKELDQQILFDFYEDNYLFSIDDKADKSDKSMKKTNIHLYYREYVGFDKECLIDNEDLFFMNSDYFKVSKRVRKLIIVVLSFSIVALFGIPFLIYYLSREDNDTILIIIGVIGIIFFEIFLIAALGVSVNMSTIVSCGDEYTSAFLDSEIHQKKMNQIYILVMLILNSLLLIFYLAYQVGPFMVEPINRIAKTKKKQLELKQKFGISINKIKTIQSKYFSYYTNLWALQDGRFAVANRWKMYIYNSKDNYEFEDIINEEKIVSLCQLDNTNIVIGNKTGAIKIWSKSSIGYQFLTYFISSHNEEISYMGSLSNNRIASSSGNEIKIWRTQDNTILLDNQIVLNSKVKALLSIKEKNIVITNDSENKVYIISGSTYQILSVILDANCQWSNIYQLDENRIILGDNDAIKIIDLSQCQVEDTITMKGKAFLNLSDNLLLIENNTGLILFNKKTKEGDNMFYEDKVVNFIIKLDNNTFVTSDSIQITIWSHNMIDYK